MDNVKRILESKCQKCTNEFYQDNFGKIFPYNRCKRCDVGRKLHELDKSSWCADFVKRD